MTNKERKMSVDEMIMAGADWKDITARINEIKAEKAAAEKKKIAEATERSAVQAARERAAEAVVAYMMADNILTPDEAKEFTEDVIESFKEMGGRMKAMKFMAEMFGTR